MGEEDEVSGKLSVARVSTRRGLLKMAGAAAAGAAGTAGLMTLRALPVAAGGSGFTIALMTPTRIVDTRNGHGPLTGGNEYEFGPFPVPGSTTFFSDSYYGMMANLTATGWNGQGWLSIRGQGVAAPNPPVSNVNFSGTLSAFPNFVITAFGAPTVGGMLSNGKIVVHCGGAASLSVDVIIDLFAYLVPDV
jgi:hypothetical protein